MADNIEQNLDLEKILATLASLQKPDHAPIQGQQQEYDPSQSYQGYEDVGQINLPQENLLYHQPSDPRLVGRPALQHRPTPPRPQDRSSTPLIDPATITEWKQGLRCVSKISAQNPDFAASIRKDRKEKKDKSKDQKHEQKKSKYTKEPEMLFKAKLTPVAATEVARKEKKKEKKEKKDKKSKSREVVVHEFEKNTKTPSFLKETKTTTEKKPAVEYVNGQGWVDEDGNVVEPETGKARNRRVLELVDKPVETAPKKPVVAPKASKQDKKKVKATPPPSSSESEVEDDSSVVSSSSEDVSSDSEVEESEAGSAPSTPAPVVNDTESLENTRESDPEAKEVHPLEALFKRPKPSPGTISIATPKRLTPINTSFSFFENNDESVDVDNKGEAIDNVPTTPFTQRDLEWRGLRSAAPTPDTAAIGRRFSFDWRKGSQEADDDDDEEMGDAEAEQQLSQNTKANAANKHLPGVTEEDEEDADAGADQEEAGTEEKPESEFRKWFWESRGDLNRAWKKRRRDALKSKRLTENRKMTPHRRAA